MSENIKKDNRGYLYPNKNKNKPTQPDLTGKVLIEGKEFRISAWENQTPEGNKYLSLAFSLPVPQTENQNGSVQNGTNTNTQNKDASQQKIAAPISEDFDLDAILNSTDDENPFN